MMRDGRDWHPAHCLHGFGPMFYKEDTWGYQQYVSPAHVSSAIKETEGEPNVHGMSQGAQAGREAAQLGE